MVGCLGVNRIEQYLALVQDVMYTEEVSQSTIKDAVERLPQDAVHIYASITVWVKFVSVLKDWGYNALAPDVREMSNAQNEVD